MNPITQVLRISRALELVTSSVAATGLVVVMFIVCIDVAGRYIFNSPLTWSYDLVSLYLLPLVFFLALGDTLRRRYHVCVDIFSNHFKPRTQVFWGMVNWALASALFITIALLMFGRAYTDYVQNNVIVGDYNWPVWISAAIGCVGSGLMSLRLVAGTVAYAMAFFLKNPALADAVTDTPLGEKMEHLT